MQLLVVWNKKLADRPRLNQEDRLRKHFYICLTFGQSTFSLLRDIALICFGRINEITFG